MDLSVALIIAASFAILCTFYIGKRILTIDFSECHVHSCRKKLLIRFPERYQNSFKGFSYISSDF